MRFVVVTGMAGSGKTAALKALEDLGFFCIDNLPVALLPKLAELSLFSREMVTKVAVGMDLRERSFVESFKSAFEELDSLGTRVEMVFLDSGDEILLNRFNETRRRHPLAKDHGTVYEGIVLERKLLEPIKEHADITIDTSSMSVHELKRTLWDYFKREAEEKTMQITFISFGFRNGFPRDVNLLFDARFLPNPYFISELKSFNGTDPRVFKFVFSTPEAEESFQKLRDLISYLIPQYQREGKAYLTVAVGCTGGKHRSVAFVERLADELSEGRKIRIVHRDMSGHDR